MKISWQHCLSLRTLLLGFLPWMVIGKRGDLIHNIKNVIEQEIMPVAVNGNLL